MQSIIILVLWIISCNSSDNSSVSFIDLYRKYKAICDKDNTVLPRKDSINVDTSKQPWSLNSNEIHFLAVRDHFKYTELFD